MTLAIALALLGALAPQGLAADAPPDASAVSVRITSSSPRTARLILDSLTTRLVLELGYDPVEGSGDGWRMAGTTAIRDRRAFEKHLDATTRRRIELGQSSHPAGGFEMFACGSTDGAGGNRPNPDLARVKEEAELLTASLPADDASLPTPEFAVEIRSLGYSQADGVLGLLKALGYTTVEYNIGEGSSPAQTLYEPIHAGTWKLPVIVKLIEGSKTSIMEPLLLSQEQEQARQLLTPLTSDTRVEDMGGTYLHAGTTGEPLQRLVILHDPDEPAALKKLMKLLDEQVDVPARQIVIEALVLEINRDKINDLGLTFSWLDNSLGASWERNALGQQEAFTFDYDKFRVQQLFKVKLHALVGNGDAKILSNPSVLVLDGRQARIQIGQRVPVVTSTATANVVEQRVEYQTVGIVLNLRPRLNPEGTQVTMQAETIVSAVDPTAVQTVDDVSAPTFDNRLVQTYCRIADNTPFIVGGLISEDRREDIRRIPGLSNIPLLGPLFRRKTVRSDNREVIIVLTPHVVPKDEKNFSRLIPKDSDHFDSFDLELFRNHYRIRRQDVFDLKSLAENQSLVAIRGRVEAAVAATPSVADIPEIARLRAGEVPGEDILVRRMLWETIRRTGYSEHVDPARIITFQHRGAESEPLELARVADLLSAMPEGHNTLALAFDMTPDRESPRFKTARVEYQNIPAAEYDGRLVRANLPSGDGVTPRPTLLLSRDQLSGANLMDFLRSIMILKEILRLNSTLPLRIAEFYDGREIVYPSAEELSKIYHVVDAEAARLFFEVQQYYPAFQCAFNASIRAATRALDPGAELGPPENCTPQVPGPLIQLDESSPASGNGVGRKPKAARTGQ